MEMHTAWIVMKGWELEGNGIECRILLKIFWIYGDIFWNVLNLLIMGLFFTIFRVMGTQAS